MRNKHAWVMLIISIVMDFWAISMGDFSLLIISMLADLLAAVYIYSLSIIDKRKDDSNGK